MTAMPNVLSVVDLNIAHPPGLNGSNHTPSPLDKARPRSYSGSQPIDGLNWNNSRTLNRLGNRRYPQGMRLPSSSYHSQNQYRRTSFSNSPKSLKTDNGHTVQGNSLSSMLGAPLYQRTSRFDPFGDSNETPLSPSSNITPSRSEPVYTHYYYYDPHTNRPTLAYAEDKNSVNAANLTASTNILLDTLLNGARRDVSRSPSPPPTSQTLVETPSRPQSRSPSPPQSARPRAAAISHPSNSPVTTPPSPSLRDSTPKHVPPSSPPSAPIKVSRAQRDAIARVVANMLLNRADGVSRRGRRCSQPYVKSGLSRVVFVE
ncbi:hypothetical protein GYMLUDRAFT_54680 [Collybiopsis luxurians FD-317 M1]|nr:hypothetical protein GYMLUDRAFT_54680 [Collybiopsis luxurians FD-317 M1]